MTKLDEALGLFPSVIKCGEQWSSTCQAVLEAAKAELAALRASAAPEEGMNHRTTAEPDRAAVEKVILEFQHSYVGDHAMLLSYKGKPTKAALNFVDTILAALPSDSGKAAPVAGHPVERLWRAVGLPEYFLGNGGSNTKLYELYAAIRNELHADLRALAPATEGGGREERAAKIIHEARKVYENHVGDGAWLAMERSYFDLISAALSPSPSVGTPAQPSAQLNNGAE